MDVKVKCKECDSEFEPEKAYYHTCPSCFFKERKKYIRSTIGLRIDQHLLNSDSMAGDMVREMVEEDPFDCGDEDYGY